MRKLLPFLVLLLVIQQAHSQQLHFMSQYLQHNLMYNPAAAGMSGKNSLGVAYRSMWESFPGHPTTKMLYADFELPKLNAGLGGYIYRDETGPLSRNGVQIAYSYHINSKDGKSRLGIGIEARGLQYAYDHSRAVYADPTDPTLSQSVTKSAFDAGAGIYWKYDALSVGVAVSQLLDSKIKLTDAANTTISGKLYRHYNLTASYVFHTDESISIIPNAMFRMVENAPEEYDFGVRADYQNKVWWALNYRVRQSWSIQAGLKLFDRVGATYSYDIYTSPLGVFSEGSGAHEISLQFDLKKK